MQGVDEMSICCKSIILAGLVGGVAAAAFTIIDLPPTLADEEASRAETTSLLATLEAGVPAVTASLNAALDGDDLDAESLRATLVASLQTENGSAAGRFADTFIASGSKYCVVLIAEIASGFKGSFFELTGDPDADSRRIRPALFILWVDKGALGIFSQFATPDAPNTRAVDLRRLNGFHAEFFADLDNEKKTDLESILDQIYRSLDPGPSAQSNPSVGGSTLAVVAMSDGKSVRTFANINGWAHFKTDEFLTGRELRVTTLVEQMMSVAIHAGKKRG